jgi:glyoxylase-like metal-dependent hydrolase (beta-lactamase superfamily II)
MFGKSIFVTGPGTSSLLDGENLTLRGGHSFFEVDLLRKSQAIEILPDGKFRNMNTRKEDMPFLDDIHHDIPNFNQSWKPRGSLPRTMDIFQDGSVLLVDAPGHLPGHINILARTGQDKYVYLAGDACHDRRIMTRERDIGEWYDEEGHICCIHSNRQEAERTIERIKQLESEGVEVIFAHDVEWEQNPENRMRFFGAC